MMTSLMLIITLVALSFNSIGQTIKLDLSIKVDNKFIDSEEFELLIVNKTNNSSSNMMINNNFIAVLEYNSVYEVTVSYKNRSKTIYIDTNAPIDKWYIISGIKLSEPGNVIAGGIKYDNTLQTFTKYLL